MNSASNASAALFWAANFAYALFGLRSAANVVSPTLPWFAPVFPDGNTLFLKKFTTFLVSARKLPVAPFAGS